jgi:hypothetical protein
MILGAGVANAQPQKATDEMPAADVKTWVTFLDSLVEAIVANADHCDEMARQITAVIDEHQGAINVADKARAHHLTLPESARAHILTNMRKALPAIQTCAESDAVQTAFEKLESKTKSKG